jgi:hypothetical protein
MASEDGAVTGTGLRFCWVVRVGETAMATEPADELAAAEAGLGRLRASHMDREQAIEDLKAAFVHGTLAKDEFDRRVARAFASRTYAEVAGVTAGLPAGPDPDQPPVPVPTRDDVMPHPGRMMSVATALCAGVWAGTFYLPWPTNSEGDPPHPVVFVFFVSNLIYIFLLFVGVMNLVALRLEKRAAKRSPRRPAPGASS